MRTRHALALFTLVTALAMPVPISAQPGPPPAKGPGQGPGSMGKGPGHMAPGAGCPALLRASPELLKSEVGLSDPVILQVQQLRSVLESKGVAMRDDVTQLRQEMRDEMQQDLPDEQKLLALHRKVHALHGQMIEETIKTNLRIARLLTKEQRAKLRTMCTRPGMSWGGQGPRGRGRGTGRGGDWGGTGGQ